MTASDADRALPVGPPTDGHGVSRRSVLRGLAAGAALAALPFPAQALARAAAQATYPGRIGVELDVRGHLFVDVAKLARAYEAAAGGEVAVDANGWPLADARSVMFDARPTFAWAPPIDDPEAYQIDVSGTYALSFTGQATLGVSEGTATISDQSYDEASNTTTAKVTVPQGEGLLALSFTDTKATPGAAAGSGFKDVKLIAPGYPADSTQTFTDPVLTALEPFSTIRGMVALGTNDNAAFDEVGPVEVEWADRRVHKPTDSTQDVRLAFEYLVELCNTAGKDLWLNIPVHATDGYITELAQLVKDELRPESKVWLEYGNEVWNYGFRTYAWNAAKSEAEVAAGGSDLDYDGSTSKDDWHQRRVARRTLEISRIFGQVFGSGSVGTRLRPVLCWFILPNNALDRTRDMLEYLAANYGAAAPRDELYAIATTGYFGCGSLRGPDGQLPDGLTKEQILAACEEELPTYYGDYTALANEYGLKMNVYEGSDDTSGGGFAGDGSIAARIEAARSPEMGELTKRNLLEGFFPAGGELYMQFTLSGAYNRYGTWGATDDITKLDRNHKYPALVEVLGAQMPGGGVRLPAGVYSVRAAHSGKALDVLGKSTADGANVQQWQYYGNDNQLWRVEPVAGGAYRLLAVHSGKALEVEGSSTADGGNVRQSAPTGDRNQQWLVAPVAGRTDTYRITNVNSGKILDVSAASRDNGANVHQWQYYGNDNQHWVLRRIR